MNIELSENQREIINRLLEESLFDYEESKNDTLYYIDLRSKNGIGVDYMKNDLSEIEKSIVEIKEILTILDS